MAAFASDRRSGWVRVLVLILCALFIFATIATPPAYAVGETVALFGLAAVLSSATAALGFKLANNAEGQATLEKMVQDFAGASIAAGLLLTGTKVNGLINGMQYIKMAVHNGKTYLDERIFAWCQQWLANNGVYNSGSLVNVSAGDTVSSAYNGSYVTDYAFNYFSPSWNSNVSSNYNRYFVSSYSSALAVASASYSSISESTPFDAYWSNGYQVSYTFYLGLSPSSVVYLSSNKFVQDFSYSAFVVVSVTFGSAGSAHRNGSGRIRLNVGQSSFVSSSSSDCSYNNLVDFSSANDTGLSGTDTLGKDVIDLTLDQILEKLKEWAQDWYDAGADSVTNAATGAKDLPLTVGEKAATANPALNPDDVYNPPFALPLPGLRSGETDTKTVEQGKENASAAETATTDVAENQTVIDSLVNWALGYISPDTGLFSKFPLCVPYDAYLLACAALGVDVVESDSIFSASPDDLSSIVQTGTDEQSEGFTPVFTISNDLTLDGYTYPLKLTIDLTEWTPLIKFFRLAISITVIAELIGAEYKRIKGK